MQEGSDSESNLHCQTYNDDKNIRNVPLGYEEFMWYFSPFPSSRKISRGVPFSPTAFTQAGVTKHLVARLSINPRIECLLILAITTRSSPSFTDLGNLFSYSVPAADGPPLLFSFSSFWIPNSSLLPANLLVGLDIPA